jgi:hypothetical protein
MKLLNMMENIYHENGDMDVESVIIINVITRNVNVNLNLLIM